jgi:hypothetical protein
VSSDPEIPELKLLKKLVLQNHDRRVPEIKASCLATLLTLVSKKLSTCVIQKRYDTGK